MNRLKSGLAQSANNAGVTIIIIAVLIVVYLLFLPPQQRAELLGEEQDNTGILSDVESNLFSDTPGRLYPVSSNTIDHTLPSFMVFTVTNAEELKRTASLYVKNSAFSDTTDELVFFYDSQTIQDVKLSFNIAKHSGRLKILLNNQKIFEGEIEDASPDPIRLPEGFLQTKNTLVFEVSSPGAAFWRVNEYDLKNVLVSAKVTDYSSSFSEQHFAIPLSEYENLEKAVFEFLPDCPANEEGLVQILINNRVIYTGYPDCGVKTNIELSKELLIQGDNVLVATTNTGAFLIDMPKIITYLTQTEPPVFYFNVQRPLHEAIYFGNAGVMLTLRFTDAESVKRGNLNVNGYQMYFETQDITYQTFVEPEFIVPGPNSIKIIPHDTMDVTEIRADVV